jgi:hypothetical protein
MLRLLIQILFQTQLSLVLKRLNENNLNNYYDEWCAS